MKANPKLFKRLGSFLVALIMSLTYLAGLNLSAFATSGDMGSQGGGMGGGNFGVNQWVAVQGVRLTALDAHTGNPIPEACSIDWVKDNPCAAAGKTEDQLITFGAELDDGTVHLISKQEYRTSQPLEKQIGRYQRKSPPAEMPDIIIQGYSNIEQIREYFIDEVIVKCFCAHVYGLNSDLDITQDSPAQALFDRFLSGELVLAIEPLVFMLWDGQLYGGTVTEIALLSKETDAKRKEEGKKTLLNINGSLTHSTAPDALFLEEAHPELNYPNTRPAYNGYFTVKINKVDVKRGYYSNDKIIESCLGIGIVWFTPPAPTVHHHIYNVKLNVPKGSTLSYNGHDIPLSTPNITKILKGSPVKDDKGASVTGGAELAKAMLNYCNAKGFIVSKGTSGVGVWEDVISYELDNAFIFFVFKRSRRHVTA